MMKLSVMKKLSVPVLLGTAFVLSACAYERDPAVTQSPIYKAGFSDGCQTAHTRVSGFKDTVHRDQALYEADEKYRAGWGDGYASCGGQNQYDDRSIFNERRDNSGFRY